MGLSSPGPLGNSKKPEVVTKFDLLVFHYFSVKHVLNAELHAETSCTLFHLILKILLKW